MTQLPNPSAAIEPLLIENASGTTRSSSLTALTDTTTIADVDANINTTGIIHAREIGHARVYIAPIVKGSDNVTGTIRIELWDKVSSPSGIHYSPVSTGTYTVTGCAQTCPSSGGALDNTWRWCDTIVASGTERASAIEIVTPADDQRGWLVVDRRSSGFLVVRGVVGSATAVNVATAGLNT